MRCVFFVAEDFAKSYVAAHTRKLANGKVVAVRGFHDGRNRDPHTPDMFRRPASAPKMRMTEDQARNPERYTPDIFTGEIRAHGFPIEGLTAQEKAYYSVLRRHAQAS